MGRWKSCMANYSTITNYTKKEITIINWKRRIIKNAIDKSKIEYLFKPMTFPDFRVGDVI